MATTQDSADYLESLNPKQRQAVLHGATAGNAGPGRPLLVIAGAGTGKTMTLAHRVAHLVVGGADPARILLLTFTRRAAVEMTRRVDAIVRQAVRGRKGVLLPAGVLPWSGTFHSIANRLLRRFAPNLGLDPGFSVLDRGDAADVMDVVRHELGLSKVARRFPKKDACLAIYSRCVNAREPLDTVLRTTHPWCVDWAAELRSLFAGYVARKQQIQVLDYDDLLLYWSHLVGDTEFAAEIGAWFDHVLVDEYQDTNILQAGILHALKPDGAGVTVVGDDAQSIYSFRAAEVGNILGFAASYEPAAAVVALEQNYRSTQPILDTANRLIAESERQYEKRLAATVTGGERPAYVTVEDADAEAEYVVETVLTNREAGMRLMDQAVLFRASHHSDRLELELVRRNIPYVKYGGLKFLEAAHVKDVLAVLKWAENPKNEVAAFRVLKLLPGMGPAHARRCLDRVAGSGFRLAALAGFPAPPGARPDWPAFAELMTALAAADPAEAGWQGQLASVRHWYRPQLERLYDGADTREADIDQLEGIAGRYATRERFLTELTLDPPAAAGDLAGDPRVDEDYLVLSTVHSAKGQEWEAVLVLNVTDGNFPSEFATGSDALIEEERRLLYVAMTRARRQLALVAPLRFHVTAQHRHGDRHVYGARSRFLTDGLLETMQRTSHGRPDVDGVGARQRPASGRTLDVGSRLRDMWA